MSSFKIRFIDSQSITIAELNLPAVPREGETIRFRAGAGGETMLTVKAVTYLLADPTDPPAEKEPHDVVVVLGLTPIGEVSVGRPSADKVPAAVQ
jgi:hypothetical protein